MQSCSACSVKGPTQHCNIQTPGKRAKDRPKVTPENTSFSRSLWYLASIFFFSFLFLLERARHVDGAFGYVCTAGQWYDSSLTLAQLYAYKLPSSGSRTTVVLKESFKTPLGFWNTPSVTSVLWGNLLPNSLYGNFIFYAFTFIAPFAI